MIHAGLNINFKNNENKLAFNQCCLSTRSLTYVVDPKKIWLSKELLELRNKNDNNVWDEGCWECERLENGQYKSFRNSMIERLGINKNVSGPSRIDFLFDRSCNLACINCGPNASTFWQKHLSDNKIPSFKYDNTSTYEQLVDVIDNLDLSNLTTIQFCGGEPMISNAYWKIADLILHKIPNAVEKVDMAINTNGTQKLNEKHLRIIEKFRLVKFIISIDGTKDKFEYLRWPAKWNHLLDNLTEYKEKLPVNVMFMIQEVINPLNLYSFDEVKKWAANDFSTNRLGDPIDYNFQLSMNDNLNVNFITEKYYQNLNKEIKPVLDNNWQEIAAHIKRMIEYLDKFDKIRNLSWVKTFPEVAEFYSDYLNK
jgi:organic radical activating enzyme